MSQLRARDINTVSSCYTRRNLLSLVAPAAELPVYVRNCNDTIDPVLILDAAVTLTYCLYKRTEHNLSGLFVFLDSFRCCVTARTRKYRFIFNNNKPKKN